MQTVWCVCGFAETEGVDETIGDHLREMFTPGDGIGPDGIEHVEGERDFVCFCGAGGTQGKLDDHFLDVFTPADAIGSDGRVHKVA
jgi:hypothetical protein